MNTLARSGVLACGFLVAAMLSTATAVAEPTPTGDRSKELEERFRIADLDGDGALSPTEVGQASWFAEQLDRFERLDTNRSGTVTLAEIGAAVSAQVQEWLSADSDGDGRISAAEARARSGTLGDVFRRADDGDGMVTREELESLSQRSYYEQGDLPSVAPNLFEKRF